MAHLTNKVIDPNKYSILSMNQNDRKLYIYIYMIILYDYRCIIPHLPGEGC